MDASDTKLLNFENMVIKDAREKRDAVLKEIAQTKSEMLARIKDEIDKSAQARLRRATAKIVKEKNERIIQKQLSCKQEILNERQRLIDALFDNVKKRLSDFTASDSYGDYLIKTVSASKKKLEGAGAVVILKRDEKHAALFTSLGFEVSYTDDDIIGGCLLVDKVNGMRVDETFATKLEAAKDRFLETYNIKI
ncbi:MAG: V-type ATP synthase subunit E [Firmicutes bacterium ADurb.Bin193]|nr:MAG: V-type ATP synthase subunit E [Firmicutes bacterium ADurb.Bin193]